MDTFQAEKKIDFDKIFVILLFGGLWGFTEATLGFAFHMLPRLTGIPAFAGLLMFPIGVWFMLSAVKLTKLPAAAFLVAAIAAGIKASSVVLPAVPWLFVQNPSLSILLEGAVVTAFVGLLNHGKSRADTCSHTGIVGFALSVSIAWRVLFIVAHYFFGIRWGLPAKGLDAVMQFLLLDSVVNSLLIMFMIYASLPEKLTEKARALAKPLPVALILAFAVFAEYALNFI